MRLNSPEIEPIEKKGPDRPYVIDGLAAGTVGRIQKLRGVETDLRLETPPPEVEADYAVPCHPLGGVLYDDPEKIAKRLDEEINEELPDDLFSRVEARRGYLNFDLDPESFSERVIDDVLSRGAEYGSQDLGQGEIVVIDMSSPNTAKPMSAAHLLSTVIGESLARIFAHTGHRVIKDNHLGDWGTHFGMLLEAHDRWGDEVPELESDRPREQVMGLYKLYTQIHRKVDAKKRTQVKATREKVDEEGMKAVPGLLQAYREAYANLGSHPRALDRAINSILPQTELEKAGRKWFRRLEAGAPVAVQRWEQATKMSRTEFDRIYDILGVDFDYTLGEGFYVQTGLTDRVIKEVRQLDCVRDEEGALVADLTDVGLGEMVIQTSDGRTLYSTRDLATAIYREEKLGAEKILYVVGEEQEDYFKQCFELLGRMGYEVSRNCEHISFGLLRLPEGAMSTRAGRVVFLNDVIKTGIDKARQVIEKSRRTDLTEEEADKVAEQVAVGAMTFAVLSRDRQITVEFDWDRMLNFRGDSGPYVQYAHVRAEGILDEAKRAERKREEIDGLPQAESFAPEEIDLAKSLVSFPRSVEGALNHRQPAVVARDTLRVAQSFTDFYHRCPVVDSRPKTRERRLQLTAATAQVLENGLDLLGIEAPEKM